MVLPPDNDSAFDYLRYVADTYLLPFGLRIIIGIVVFYVGRTIARALLKAFDRVMDRSRLDVSLRKFLHDLVYAVSMVAVVIATLDTVGVKTTALLAVLGAAGLAIGLALQGSLSNFAAGVMLILLRPYKIGDTVSLTVSGSKYVGRVEAIKVFHSVLVTPDNREVTIPNGQIITGAIENLTVLGRRRIDLIVRITDARDLAQLRSSLESVVLADPRVHAEPAPAVEIAEVSDNMVRLNLRPWTSVAHYQAVAADTMERVKDTLVASGHKFSVTLHA
jgi:small conductance mechanosensitive channel